MRRPCNHRIHTEYGGRIILKIGGTVVPPSNFQTKITEICTHKAFPANHLHGHGHAHTCTRTTSREARPGCKVILETLQPGRASLSKSAVAALSRKNRNRAGRSACKVIWETLQSDRPAHRRCKFAGLPLQRPTPGARSVTITTDHCALIRPSIVTTSIEPIP